MIKYGIVIFIALLLPGNAVAQSNLYLQHNIKSNRQKKISLRHEYTFHTVDTVFYRARILSWTDTTLIVAAKIGSDTTVLTTGNIQYLEKHSKHSVFEVTAYLGVILLTVTPVVWAFEGGAAALGTLQGAGTLAAISVPGLLVKTIGRKKDLKNKWSIRTE